MHQICFSGRAIGLERCKLVSKMKATMQSSITCTLICGNEIVALKNLLTPIIQNLIIQNLSAFAIFFFFSVVSQKKNNYKYCHDYWENSLAKQTGRQTDRLTNRHRLTDRQTHIHTNRRTDTQIDRQTNKHTYIQTDRQTDKQCELIILCSTSLAEINLRR